MNTRIIITKNPDLFIQGMTYAGDGVWIKVRKYLTKMVRVTERPDGSYKIIKMRTETGELHKWLPV